MGAVRAKELPRGKDEVVAAILQAGRILFATRSYRDVSIRLIAETAGVNPGLIHRHIGAKRDVVKQVFIGYGRHFAAVNTAAATPLEGLVRGFHDEQTRDFLNTAAYLLLSGEPIEDFITEQGGTMALLRAGEAGNSGHDGADLLAAQALLMGWTLFAPFLLKASGGVYDRAFLDDRMFSIVAQLTGPSAPAVPDDP